MPRGRLAHRFGPFDLDPASGHLSRGGVLLRLSTSVAAILVRLVQCAGEPVSKETLIEAGWGRAAISDNSLDKAISRLRKQLGDDADGSRYIETVPHRGYRFMAPVENAYQPGDKDDVEDQLGLLLALEHGRAWLDSLDLAELGRARLELDAVVRQSPQNGLAHVDLAMTYALLYEPTRLDRHPDTSLLTAGIELARIGCASMPGHAGAWATLAFLLRLSGDAAAGGAAAIKAMELDPHDLRQALRAGYVTWGEPRLKAVRHVLIICPGLALGHWLTTTVYIARGTPDALVEVRLGCVAQDRQTPGSPFFGVGLHLLHAQLCLAQGRIDEAVAELHRELATLEHSRQVFARECAAHVWYTLGAIHRRQQQPESSREALGKSLTIASGHGPAYAALHGEVLPTLAPMDAAIARAIALARGGRRGEAAHVYRDALRSEPPGSAGWILPIEPMLDVVAHPELWAEALALVRVRAA